MLDIIFDLFDLALLFHLKRKWEIPKEWSGTVLPQSTKPSLFHNAFSRGSERKGFRKG